MKGKLPRCHDHILPEEIEHALETGIGHGHESPASFVATNFMGEALVRLLRSGRVFEDNLNPEAEEDDLVREAHSALLHETTLNDRIDFEMILCAHNMKKSIQDDDAEGAAQAAIRFMAQAWRRDRIYLEALLEAAKNELQDIAAATKKAETCGKRAREIEPHVDARELVASYCPGLKKPLPPGDDLKIRIHYLGLEARRYDFPSWKVHRRLLELLMHAAALADPAFDAHNIPGKRSDVYDVLVRAGAREAGALGVGINQLWKYRKKDSGKPGQDYTICATTGTGKPPWQSLFPDLFEG